MITLEAVCFNYDQTAAALRNVSLHIAPGEFTAIVGGNGAGKSTLIRLMRGLLRPGSGRVFFNGGELRRTQVSALAAQVGFLFQNPDRQLCKNTVREELLFSLRQAGVSEDRREALVKKALAAFGFRAEDPPFSLSRGERQRLALASALVAEPRLLLLDEPTTGLDYRECTAIMERIAALNRRGVTVVMICHDMELVLDYARRVLVLSAGALIGDGESRAVFRDRELMKRASLLPPQMIGLAQELGGVFAAAAAAEELCALALDERGKR